MKSNHESYLTNLEELIRFLENLRHNVEWAAIKDEEVRLRFASPASAQEFYELFDDPLTLCVDDQSDPT